MVKNSRSSPESEASSKSKFDSLIRIFRISIERATKECNSESEKLRVLSVDTVHVFSKLERSEKFRISLMDVRILELSLLMAHILYFSLAGLYRNAFNNIRYILESAVQSTYIDSKHSNSGLRTRIEILKEIEDKKDYRAVNLIGALEIDHKDLLKREYKKLSQTIHPSHRSIIETLDFPQKEPTEVVAPVSCKEISEVFESMKIVLDMVLFLHVSCAPKTRKEQLEKNPDLIDYCKKYNLGLLSKILKIKTRRKENG